MNHVFVARAQLIDSLCSILKPLDTTRSSSSMASSSSSLSSGNDDARYASDLTVDESKLSVGGEQADVYLLQWLAKLEVALARIQDDAVVAKAQPALVKTLLRIVSPLASSIDTVSPTSSTPPAPAQQWPRPGRPARHLLARCLLLLLRRGDSRSLYDIGQTLLKIAGDDGKVSKLTFDRESKTAALYVLGDIFGSLGQQVMSLFVDIVTTTQRIFKPTSAPVIVRYHALVCLNKAILCGGKSLSDVAAKEVVKSLRSGLADKAGAVVRGCADVSARNEVWHRYAVYITHHFTCSLPPAVHPVSLRAYRLHC